MKTYVATVLHNPTYTKAHVELVDADTLYVEDRFEVSPLREDNTILSALQRWAYQQPIRPVRIVNFGYLSSCELVSIPK